MKNHTILFFIVVFLLAVLIVTIKQKSSPKNLPSSQLQNNIVLQATNEQNNINVPFQPPLDNPQERVTKKYFGIFITPKTSPVQPERFFGYHTGADFETFAQEANVDVSVHAVCSGKLLTKKYASGYGGVMVELCTLNNQPITVVYGHMKLASISEKVGADITVGDSLGVLGKGYSSETDGERKHLHLGFHEGSSVNILGYVQNKSELSQWIDPCLYVCGK